MRQLTTHFAFVVFVFTCSNLAFGQFGAVLTVPPHEFVDYTKIRSNTLLNVYEGGVIPRRFEVGDKGTKNTNLEVNIYGGSIGHQFDVRDGSIVTVNGGTFDGRFFADEGSQVSISGGSFGGWFLTDEGSHVIIAGGSFGARFEVLGDVVISGGTFSDYFMVERNSNVNLVGSEFFLDNFPIDLMSGESREVEDRVGLLSGRFSDGTPFSFDLGGQRNQSDYFATDANLFVTLVPEPTAILTGMLSFCFLFLLIRARRV